MSTPADNAGQPHLTYRRDIDGLRAVAVGAVVLYHFGAVGFGGGFVGVDIFFVISGFLITSILLADMGAAKYSLLKFYERRVRRILPALFVVLAVSGIAGLILLPPRALQDFSRSVIATIGFVSNVYFWRSTAGYFDGPAETRPLLHTWSLGVEEQFYIVFPILLAILVRWGGKRAFAITAGAFVVALAVSAWATPLYPTASFYLSPTRAWQLLAGALLALRPVAPRSRRVAEGAGVAGLLLIAFAVVLYSAQTATPGIASLAPCAGAVLLIYAGAGIQRPAVSRLLATPPFVGVGLISYSLYLWHWPVYVFLRHYLLFRPLDLVSATGGVAVAVVLAVLSWRFVEQPIRKRSILKTRGSLFAAAGVGAVILAGAAGAIIVAKGLPSRFPALSQAAMQAEPARPDWAPYVFEHCFDAAPNAWAGEACRLAPGRPGGHRVLLWGDSYAAHYAAGFLSLRDQLSASVIQYTAPRCPPVSSYVSRSNRDCPAFNRRALDVISHYGVDTVILAAKWESYMPGGRMTAAQIGGEAAALKARGLKVILVGQSPIFNFDFPDEYHLARIRSGASGPDSRAALAFDPALNAALRAASPDAEFFDPLPLLCQNRACLYRKDGQYLVADSGHLTRYGSTMVVGELARLGAMN